MRYWMFIAMSLSTMMLLGYHAGTSREAFILIELPLTVYFLGEGLVMLSVELRDRVVGSLGHGILALAGYAGFACAFGAGEYANALVLQAVSGGIGVLGVWRYVVVALKSKRETGRYIARIEKFAMGSTVLIFLVASAV